MNPTGQDGRGGEVRWDITWTSEGKPAKGKRAAMVEQELRIGATVFFLLEVIWDG